MTTSPRVRLGPNHPDYAEQIAQPFYTLSQLLRQYGMEHDRRAGKACPCLLCATCELMWRRTRPVGTAVADERDRETRMHRTEAVEIAKAFVAELEGTYEQLIVAGSLRRRLAYVGDIEVVAVPKIEQQSDGLFEGMATDGRPARRRMMALLDNDGSPSVSTRTARRAGARRSST
jgi:hypothetical protein